MECLGVGASKISHKEKLYNFTHTYSPRINKSTETEVDESLLKAETVGKQVIYPPLWSIFEIDENVIDSR